jgi:NADPH-dependent 2,4-dienoyl-CoA reductase/sulfur reductase-like enzyme
MTHFVVVGASLAGLRSVEAARKAGHDGPITLIGAEAHLPYDRPPLSKKFLDATVSGTAPESTEFRDEAYFAAELDVTLRLGAPATSLDTTTREVLLDDERIRYDLLVIATGTHARTLPLGAGLAGIHPLRTLDDARAIRAALDAGARTVVIGAGFIGSEIAASAGKRGLDVTILEALLTPLVRAVGPQLGAAIAGLHERNGTRLLCNAAVSSIDGTDSVESVTIADGTVLPADLVVVGVGAQPTTDWLAGSGLTIDNGVICDETLWTGVAGVYAAGDAARWHNPLFDRLQRLEHWTSAAEQGAAAARNALDPSSAKPYSTVPYFWSDWYDSRIQFVGIPEADEIRVVSEELGEDKFLALYRRGDRLTGCISIDRPTQIMKYRRMIAQSKSWADSLEFAGVG